MYLKSITLKGFKSFPDRTRLEFGPGVSVIVGPNGSGKSNVTDAVLWALGEQSPVAVRGQSMQDVIFGGAPGRQAGRQAEVELVLDDSEGLLNLGTPEISIVRRLDRSGEGEYRLAGARCRLVDVIELLSDTGMGKEMHSVISQGRVESIVTSKPRDRRLLIEEAAGLGKHRKRRRRAQLKLARTQDNLDRALDVEREARSRLRPLKRQAEAAELHARLERQALEARWELARDDVRAAREQLAAALQTAVACRGERERLEQELAAVGRRREAAEEALATRSAQREELSRRCYAAAGAAERIGYRTDSMRSNSVTLDRRVQQGAELLEALENRAAAPPEDEDRAARIDALQAELGALELDRQDELARALAELEAGRGELAARLVEREAALSDSRTAREEAGRALDAARQAVREAERAVEAARREAARTGGELAVVNQFLRAHTGAPGGAQVLADALEVQPGYEHAVAAALDGRLRAAVVEDLEAARGLLARAGSDGGRVLVAEAGAPQAAPGEAEPAPPVTGAERLGDRVHGEGDAGRLARALLHRVWVVDDLEAVPSDCPGVLVTRAGRVWSPGERELRQAPAAGEERVLSERNRRQALVVDAERAAQAEQQARAGLEQALAAAAQAEAAREQAADRHRAAVLARDEIAEEERRLGATIERRRSAPDEGDQAGRRAQLRAELAAERRMAEQAERERSELQARIGAIRTGLARDRELLPLVQELIAALEQVAAAIAIQRQAFDDALAADREAGEHVAARLRQCAQEEAKLHGELHEAGEALTTAEVRRQQVHDRLTDLERELGELAQRLELGAEPAGEPLPAEERQSLQGRLERLARRREQLGPVNPLAQEEYAQAVEHVEELESQRSDLEAALRELEKLIADTDRQIKECFEQTFNAAAANFEELAGQLFPGGKGRLRLVTERDGPARVLGGEPASDGEAEDGEDGLNGADQAQAGDEDLVGVEIEITPAGKSMKRLSLLSGGEKSMTALAFLFAVFLARPCPFYILDEVEAALDDLNITRFLELLGQYSGRAQFIVVTHQKRTMEAADSLYGVSMGADGVSKVVSRRMTAEPAQAA